MPRRSKIDMPIPEGMSPYHPSFNDDPPEFDEDAVLAARYRVYVPLCRGGMGELYDVEDLQTGTRGALKILPKASARRKNNVLRFKNEIRLTKQAQGHPAIARFLNDGYLDDGRQFYVTERLRSGWGVEEPENDIAACECALSVASGLGHLHRRGIVHRDIKPSNILESRTGPKIIDFGIAIQIQQDRRITTHDDGLGTLEYIPPEQFHFAIPSPSADFYALGTTLYEWLVGSHPFGPASRVEMLRAKERGTPSFSVAFGQLPKPIQSFILGCLNPDPAQRFGDESAFSENLRAAMRDAGWLTPISKPSGASSSHAPGTKRGNAQERKPPLLSKLGLLPVAALALGGLAWLAMHFPEPPAPESKESQPSAGTEQPSKGPLNPQDHDVQAPSELRPQTAAPDFHEEPRTTADPDSTASPPSPREDPLPADPPQDPRPTEATPNRPAARSPHSVAKKKRDREECKSLRLKVKSSLAELQAKPVFEALSKDPECWTHTERVRLRTLGYYIFRDREKCLREGSKTKDPQTRRFAERCKAFP